jgi:hypothetical protein
MRADKQTVTDEVWDDERVKSFLEPRPAIGKDSADFTLLLHAYQGMRPTDFDRFVAFFAAASHDLDATNEQGESFVDYVAGHRHAAPFVAAMTAAGARAAAR